MDSMNAAISSSEAAHFSIGTVSQITGIQEATLRVWERRYAFPQSSRTPGGRRQYTQQDVLRLQWVKMRIDMGMRAGKAVRAYQRAERDSAVAAALLDALPFTNEAIAATEDARRDLLEALLAYDRERARAVLDEVSAHYPRESVVLDVIGPTLSAIGNAWSIGEATVATEHFASNMLRHQLLAWMQESPPPYAVAPIVLACAPNELHEGGLLMLGVLLRLLRWPVLYLGQSLPLVELSELIEHAKPALIVFVAMSEESAYALAEWPHCLSQYPETQTPVPLIGYGGRAFNEHPELVERVPGILLGQTIREGCQRIHWLMLNLMALEP